MKTVDDLTKAFHVYYDEMSTCEMNGCYWALLHLLVSLPDICAGLEGKKRGGTRYVDWCRDYFPQNPDVTPGDRYQMRNALLHEGTTLPAQPTPKAQKDQQTQYTSFSFVDPRHTKLPVHQNVTVDTTRGINNLTVDVKSLADDTRSALRQWFEALQKDPVLNTLVEGNLTKLARVQQKISMVPVPPSAIGGGKFQISTHVTTSST
jgi:hypothetical protein